MPPETYTVYNALAHMVSLHTLSTLIITTNDTHLGENQALE
jgi:hypothetical protein